MSLGGEHDDGRDGHAPRKERLEKLDPRHARHVHVAEDERDGRPDRELVDGVQAVDSLEHDIASGPERTARLKDLTDKFAKGELEKYTKKERLLFEREMAKLQKEFGGIASLEGSPAALVIVDPREEHIAVKEATKVKAETISLLNTDCNKNAITYPILANDSALQSVKYFLETLRTAYEAGVKLRA